MPDPSVGWLSHVDQLLTLAAHISVSLATISGSAAFVLGSVLSMCARVRRFRREATLSATPQKRVAGRRAGKKGSQGRSAST